MAFNADKWFEKINTGNVVISYKGEVSSELITNSLEVIESKLDDLNEDSRLIRKVYNVLVELLQNLYHHSAFVEGSEGQESKERIAMFLVIKNGEDYSIHTGNYVHNSNIQVLKDRLDQINALTKDELKDLYKLILNNEEFSEKGGGGLGMIDAARKTGSKFEYCFEDFINGYSFFCLNININ
ncbi:MAG: SiaB family protein kinase [Bacteroidales bacterium]|nr:SiaB family protein kinase [Bacteroidales bacterium]